MARDREHAIIDLLLTLPAQNLHDAVVQIHHSGFLLDQAETDDPAQSALAIRMLRTMLASVGAAVMAHAGVDFISSGIDLTTRWTSGQTFTLKPRNRQSNAVRSVTQKTGGLSSGAARST